LLLLTLLALTLGKLLAVTGLTTLGGYLGLLTAVAAWYGSMAAVMNATAKKSVLPTFPR
jgi:succinate-acetate transporter protein